MLRPRSQSDVSLDCITIAPFLLCARSIPGLCCRIALRRSFPGNRRSPGRDRPTAHSHRPRPPRWSAESQQLRRRAEPVSGPRESALDARRCVDQRLTFSPCRAMYSLLDFKSILLDIMPGRVDMLSDGKDYPGTPRPPRSRLAPAAPAYCLTTPAGIFPSPGSLVGDAPARPFRPFAGTSGLAGLELDAFGHPIAFPLQSGEHLGYSAWSWSYGSAIRKGTDRC